jgi:hypothetical protein
LIEDTQPGEEPVLDMHRQTPGIDSIILQGASFLKGEGYEHKIEVMVAAPQSDGMASSRHIFLRVHGPDESVSYIADPIRWRYASKADEPPQRFENLFDEQEAGKYLLRDFRKSGGEIGHMSEVAITSVLAFNDPVRNIPRTSSWESRTEAWLNATRPKSRSDPRRPVLIRAEVALETVRRLAELSLSDPLAAAERLRTRVPPNGRLSNRIALLMSMHPRAATVPFAHFVQLVGNLCASGHLSVQETLSFLISAPGRTQQILMTPSNAISSHWSNAAAPIFAQTLKNIWTEWTAPCDPALSTDDLIVKRLMQCDIDPNAVGPLQLQSNFYEKTSQPTICNEYAAQASKILISCGLIRAKESPLYKDVVKRFSYLPSTIALSPSEELAKYVPSQFMETCKLAEEADARDLTTLRAKLPSTATAPNPETHAETNAEAGGLEAMLGVAAAFSSLMQTDRRSSPAKRYSSPPPQKRSKQIDFAESAANFAESVAALASSPVRRQRSSVEIIGEIATMGPTDPFAARTYAQSRSAEMQANFARADNILRDAAVSATATVAGVSPRNAAARIASRQWETSINTLDYQVFEAGGRGAVPRGEPRSSSRAQRTKLQKD